MRKLTVYILLILLYTSCVSKKVMKYSYYDNEIQFWKVDFELDSKKHTFKSITLAGTSFGPNKEALNGIYEINGKTIIFKFKYSKKIINPFFNCSEFDSLNVERLCVDSLNFNSDSISTIGRDKFSSFVMKKR